MSYIYKSPSPTRPSDHSVRQKDHTRSAAHDANQSKILDYLWWRRFNVERIVAPYNAGA